MEKMGFSVTYYLSFIVSAIRIIVVAQEQILFLNIFEISSFKDNYETLPKA